MHIEELEARIALMPLLQAEHDRRYATFLKACFLLSYGNPEVPDALAFPHFLGPYRFWGKI